MLVERICMSWAACQNVCDGGAAEMSCTCIILYGLSRVSSCFLVGKFVVSAECSVLDVKYKQACGSRGTSLALHAAVHNFQFYITHWLEAKDKGIIGAHSEVKAGLNNGRSGWDPGRPRLSSVQLQR